MSELPSVDTFNVKNKPVYRLIYFIAGILAYPTEMRSVEYWILHVNLYRSFSACSGLSLMNAVCET